MPPQFNISQIEGRNRRCNMIYLFKVQTAFLRWYTKYEVLQIYAQSQVNPLHGALLFTEYPFNE